MDGNIKYMSLHTGIFSISARTTIGRKSTKKVTQEQINDALKQLMTHTKTDSGWVQTIDSPKLQQFIKAILNVS